VAIPGSPTSHLYFLTRGYADVYMNDLLIDTLGPGDSFCEAVSSGK
jgi:CRP-like cAMP-binding protein